jgi:hypothetical protein
MEVVHHTTMIENQSTDFYASSLTGGSVSISSPVYIMCPFPKNADGANARSMNMIAIPTEPINNEERCRLDRVVLEAARIRSRHDGMHDMHRHYAMLRMWQQSVDDGSQPFIDWDNVGRLLFAMRFADRHRRFPRPHEMPHTRFTARYF